MGSAVAVTSDERDPSCLHRSRRPARPVPRGIAASWPTGAIRRSMPALRPRRGS